ncbi:MAG: Hsp20/alpha crystallin family protein [Gemmatimonadetes bacterium]|nr:Hsp20/alpha crystallin family protein [Gemmatimonadota bacterium]
MLTLRPRNRLPDLLKESGDIFDTLFREFLTGPTAAPFATDMLGWSPVVDLVDAGEEYVLSAEIPGVKPEDVDVEFIDGVLTLRGTKKAEYEAKGSKYHLFERGYGAFERSFRLPPSIEPEGIKAEFEDGVVTVHIPKMKAAVAKKIEIAVAK